MSEGRWNVWDMGDTAVRYTVYYADGSLSVKYNDVDYTLDKPLIIPEECHMMQARLNGPVLHLTYYDGPTLQYATAWHADFQRFTKRERDDDEHDSGNKRLK
jgi:hypothetical protein